MKSIVYATAPTTFCMEPRFHDDNDRKKSYLVSAGYADQHKTDPGLNKAAVEARQ